MKALMKKILLAALIGAASAMSTVYVQAQVAGTTTIPFAVFNIDDIAHGWSAKKNILGKLVYNEAGFKVGKIEDLIVDLEKNVSYVIVGAGGFVGIGRHDVAIPVSAIRQEGGKFVLAGATKESVKAMPSFVYASDTSRRDRLIEAAHRDVDKAKEMVAGLESRTDKTLDYNKTKMDSDIAVIKQDQKAVEDSLAKMKLAGAARWKDYENEIDKATARLRKSVAKASV